MVKLSPEQEGFIARACAFIDTNPSREDIERLLTLATLQLPEPAVVMLRCRADRNAGAPAQDPFAPPLQ